ncbi:hypothetical protein [Flavihumibacter sp. ZG627]|uniref:hypothetical protein n=1 Tax=Flavihumibacter sp. ZG627 TaxID=1463156 RepID=UPI00057DDAD3|nr:hypothetical protein [Flavihumibacter sp. ZG627]KIC90524.1 hypothetical protein HY58_11275 [Flavihumibacter sp. ZG627]
MRIMLLLLCFLPLVAWAQKDESFAKFVNEDGTLVRGSSVTKFYERQIPVYNLQSNPTANSTVLRFSMGAENAAGVLHNNLLSNIILPQGEIIVTYTNFSGRLVRYKINMENIKVVDYADADGVVTIQLRATRIGWTYYTYTKSGLQSISSKHGWDAETNTAWTNF